LERRKEKGERRKEKGEKSSSGLQPGFNKIPVMNSPGF
jgi:hypothetical protein